MNTDTPKKVLTAEQKARKNELARARRAKNKEEKEQAILSQIPAAVESDESGESDIEIDTAEDPVVIDEEEERKRAIAEKRRQSLAVARSKIKPKSQLAKEKDEEIQKIKEENQRLREEKERVEKLRETRPKVIKKVVKQSRPPPPREPARPSVDYLTEQTYAEQLKARLRENMLNKIMMDTFM